MRHDAHDGLERGGLARPVAPEQRHDLARPHVEVDPVEHVGLAVPGVQVAHLQQRVPAIGASAGRGLSHPRPHVGLDHVGVARHRRVVALGQHLAAGEHGDGVREVLHHAQVVLDHQHRAVRRHLLDQGGDALHVLVPHARGGLVEQHHLGLEGERGGDLERALAPVGQLDRRGVAAKPREAHRVEQLAGPASSSASSTRSERQKSKERAALALERDAHVLEHGRCGKTAEIWNERTSPEPRDVGRAAAR